MTTLIFTVVIFGLCIIGLSIGVIFHGMVISGTCSSAADVLGETSCACGRRSKDVCPSEDKSGLLALAEIGDPSRIVRHDHHDEGMEV